MLRIEGFAAPYRKPNSYNETFATRAFAGKLRPCKMLLMHDIPVGVWDEAWEDYAGIWVRGRLIIPYACENVDAILRELPEMSVSWRAFRGSAKARNTREFEDSLNKPVVIGPGDNNGIAEVSLVDRGAFTGTWWKIIGGDNGGHDPG
jgi:hypothetical protein